LPQTDESFRHLPKLTSCLNQQESSLVEAGRWQSLRKDEKQEERAALAARTTEIVTAYVTRNTFAIAELGDLIGTVGRAPETLGREETKPAKPEPAVPVRRFDAGGSPHLPRLRQAAQDPSAPSRPRAPAHAGRLPRTVRARVRLSHGRTGYSRRRSEMAKRVGLGQRSQAPSQRRQPRSGA
jgi:hypothetical protein